MTKQIHSFNQSKNVEDNSTHIHDDIYLNYTKSIQNKRGLIYKLKIDREICSYNTDLGKNYQQADTDVLLYLNDIENQNNTVKKISEKTRTKFYNDLYLEVISVLKWNDKKSVYEFKELGWGLKNEELGPDSLSMLFLDKNNNKYTSVFIEEYQKLKQEIFNKALRSNLKNPKFDEWLNKKIKIAEKNGQKSFQVSTEGQGQYNISKVIFAKNLDYYTIGFVFKMDYIKSFVPVLQSTNEIKINSVNKNNIG